MRSGYHWCAASGFCPPAERNGTYKRQADVSAKQLVKLYRQRVQIEESFRDMTERTLWRGVGTRPLDGRGPLTIRVLTSLPAAFLLWLLLCTSAERAGWHKAAPE
jgi:hypothetical protein